MTRQKHPPLRFTVTWADPVNGPARAARNLLASALKREREEGKTAAAQQLREQSAAQAAD
ncbi:hypothetical protein [Deinococcus peraridilitoris]|uniref:Uncharacterized protein n=1 Tax=Deinococcus peraridilitoris (strain DSM 19664 / LMG 22246 / CIP 109416 / KR-200) TaxID=937777 RepID=K9ZWU3_DEIPD|nr:hypothetical protein [Deinococcus peraridilitoris]AFZ66098.1 hypothetical protein Deipe_0502 [Deinococcus peraridilitoris DSM 19664]